MTRDEAVLLARKFKADDYKDIPSILAVCHELADFVIAQSGAAESGPVSVPVPSPPAVPSEHGLQNAVPAPGGAPVSQPPGEPRGTFPSEGGSLANFACCNRCSGEHHHCPNCGEYVKGVDILYCSGRCEKAHKRV